MVEIENCSVMLGGSLVLNAVSLSLRRGSICYVLGHNGSGKSTLLRTILGINKPSQGKITISGIDVTPINRLEYLPHVGAMIEQASLYPHLTTRQNLDLIRRYYDGIPPARVDEILEILDCPATLQTRQVRHLSMGWKQRVGLGIAFMHRPLLILLDEPTNALDPTASQAILSLISHLNSEQQTTFIICSHQMDEANELASHVIILREGQVAYDSSSDPKLVQGNSWHEVYQHVNSL